MIDAQTIRSKAAPVVPTAIAVTFNDLPAFVVDGPAEVSSEGLVVVKEGEDERGEFVRARNVGEWFWPSGDGERSGWGEVLERYPVSVLE